MDEKAYRQILSTSIIHACPFERSILTHCAACSQAVRHNIAEREVVVCGDESSLERCITLRDALRDSFTFALGKLHIDEPLPHAQEMRMQCGGLKALQFMQNGSDEILDVAGLLQLARQKFGPMENYPYSQIVQFAMRNYKPR